MRINLFTKNRLQLKYLMLIVVAMLVPSLLVGSCLYYFIFTVMAEQLAIPESIAMNLIPVLDKINAILVVGLIPLFMLLFIWGLILSHRFLGPIERLERDLDKILAGDLSVRLKVRDKDDLKDIIDKLNKVLDKIRG